MASFKGQAEYSIDNKGRVAIPAKMRIELAPEAKNTFVAMRGFEQCVFLYPQDMWAQVEARIEELNPFKPETRDFIRTVYRWLEEVVLDGQGRMMIPKTLMDYAGLSDRALIIGAFDHIEIWDPEAFNRYVNERTEDYETLAERVMTI